MASMRRELIVDALILLVLALVGYGFLLTPGEAPYSPHSDFVAQGLATKTVLWNSLRAGDGIPFWRHDELAGNVALTNPQSLYTYPLHLLFYLMEPVKAVGPTFWLHFLVAGFVGYIVAMSLGLGRAARLLTAAAMMFSFKLIMVAYSAWLPAIPNIVLFPLLFAATIRLLRKPNLGSMLLLAATGTLILHAGHLQFTYYALLFLVALFLADSIGRMRRRRTGKVGRNATLILGAALLAVAMTAYLFLPLIGDAPLLSRGKAGFGFFLGGHPLTPKHLGTLLFPEMLGTPLDGSYTAVELWEDVAYFGIVPLLLALFGIVAERRRPWTMYATGGFAVSLLLSIKTPVLKALYAALPGFRLFRLPGRFLFFAAFFGIVLAGIGAEQLVRRLAKRDGRPWLPGAVVGVLIAVIALEGSIYARRYLKMAPADSIMPGKNIREFFDADDEIHRVAVVSRPTLNYGWSATLDIQTVNGFDPYNYRHFQEYMDLLRNGAIGSEGARVWTDVGRVKRWDLLDAINVKYLVFSHAMNLPTQRFAPAASLADQPRFVFYQGMTRGNLHIYRNKGCLPRARFSVRTRMVKPGETPQEVVAATDIRRFAVVEDNNMGTLAEYGSDDGDRIDVALAADGAVIRTNAKGARFVVISEVWHPGWQATMDGEPLPLYRTNLAMLGAETPPGEHVLRLRFRPRFWTAGLVLTWIGWIVFIGLAIAAIAARHHASSTAQQASTSSPAAGVSS